jgi:ribosomal protein L37E
MAETLSDPAHTEARKLIADRFPEFRCVRCGEDNFLLRSYTDSSLVPGLRDPHLIELICSNCGFQERHVLEGLRGELQKFASNGSDDG